MKKQKKEKRAVKKERIEETKKDFPFLVTITKISSFNSLEKCQLILDYFKTANLKPYQLYGFHANIYFKERFKDIYFKDYDEALCFKLWASANDLL